MRKTLGLHEHAQIRIVVNKPGRQAANPSDDPLLELIGIGKGGTADGAEDYDSRLYHRTQTV